VNLSKIDRYYLEVVKLTAQLSKCIRLKVGAVIVKDKRPIANGYNGTPVGYFHNGKYDCEDELPDGSLKTDHNRVIHAEANAILFCAREGLSTKGCTIYITHSPCPECSKMILQAGIKKVVFIEKYRDDSGLKLLSTNGVEVIQAKS